MVQNIFVQRAKGSKYRYSNRKKGHGELSKQFSKDVEGCGPDE